VRRLVRCLLDAVVIMAICYMCRPRSGLDDPRVLAYQLLFAASHALSIIGPGSFIGWRVEEPNPAITQCGNSLDSIQESFDRAVDPMGKVDRDL
jgi:hypothetical protein